MSDVNASFWSVEAGPREIPSAGHGGDPVGILAGGGFRAEVNVHRTVVVARVSTAEQNLGLQLDALKKAECKRIYEEHGSGKDAARLELLSCLKALRAGDVLVVWRLDRLGRSLSDLVRIASQLEHRKVGLESITEKIETVSSAGKLVFHVFAALAEFERNVIRERTVAGLKAARARGRLGGRPEKLSAKDKQQMRVLLKDPAVRVKDVARRFGVSVATLYKRVGVVTPEK
jgi:DNA invertase Pin-like site-specific DNA recombinase